LRQFYWEARGLGVEIVAAANATPEEHLALRNALDLPFLLLADADGQVAAAYDAFHENEPRGRAIARPGFFLIDSADNGGIVRWEYVGPTSRHRVPPSRLLQEILTMRGQRHQIVSVVVPSEAEIERVIAERQHPPLGFFSTPDITHRPAPTEREFLRELAMYAYSELHRLAAEGWSLVAVLPEINGSLSIGQRYVFERTLA
jgi:hypothetical protein